MTIGKVLRKSKKIYPAEKESRQIQGDRTIQDIFNKPGRKEKRMNWVAIWIKLFRTVLVVLLMLLGLCLALTSVLIYL